MKNTSILFLLAAPLAFGAQYGEPKTLAEGLGGISAATPASLVALLGNPQQWNGQLVSTSGFLRSDLHGVIVFISSEYCTRGDTVYGALVDIEMIEPEVSWRSLPTEECKYSRVEGLFFNTPHPGQRPNHFVYRWRPAFVEANFIYVE